MNNLQFSLHLLKNIGTCSYSMQLLSSPPAAITHLVIFFFFFFFLKAFIWSLLLLASHKPPSEHHLRAPATHAFCLQTQCGFASAVSPFHLLPIPPHPPILSLKTTLCSL